MISFVLLAQASQPSINFDISELVYSTVIDGNEAGVDLVLIQLLLLSYVNHVVLTLTSILQA